MRMHEGRTLQTIVADAAKDRRGEIVTSKSRAEVDRDGQDQLDELAGECREGLCQCGRWWKTKDGGWRECRGCPVDPTRRGCRNNSTDFGALCLTLLAAPRSS